MKTPENVIAHPNFIKIFQALNILKCRTLKKTFTASIFVFLNNLGNSKTSMIIDFKETTIIAAKTAYSYKKR